MRHTTYFLRESGIVDVVIPIEKSKYLKYIQTDYGGFKFQEIINTEQVDILSKNSKFIFYKSCALLMPENMSLKGDLSVI